MQFRLPWLITAISLCAALMAVIAPMFGPINRGSSMFPKIDGKINKGEYIDLEDGDRLLIRYGAVYDSGAEIERVTGESTVWIAQSKPLGAWPYEYEHTLSVSIGDGDFSVQSSGVLGSFIETRSLKSGKLIKRTEHRPDSG